jgi:hypothetical protein
MMSRSDPSELELQPAPRRHRRIFYPTQAGCLATTRSAPLRMTPGLRKATANDLYLATLRLAISVAGRTNSETLEGARRLQVSN